MYTVCMYMHMHMCMHELCTNCTYGRIRLATNDFPFFSSIDFFYYWFFVDFFDQFFWSINFLVIFSIAFSGRSIFGWFFRWIFWSIDFSSPKIGETKMSMCWQCCTPKSGKIYPFKAKMYQHLTSLGQKVATFSSFRHKSDGMWFSPQRFPFF